MSKKPILIISDNTERAEEIKKEYEDKGRSLVEIAIRNNFNEAWQAMIDSPIVEVHFDPLSSFYKEIIS